MKEKTPVAKINLRGNLENKEFASKVGKILGMILPNEACSTSSKEKISSFFCLSGYFDDGWTMDGGSRFLADGSIVVCFGHSRIFR